MATQHDISLFKLPDGEYVSIPASKVRSDAGDARVTGVIRGIAYTALPGVRSTHRTYIVQLDDVTASGYSCVSVEARDVELLDDEVTGD